MNEVGEGRAIRPGRDRGNREEGGRTEATGKKGQDRGNREEGKKKTYYTRKVGIFGEWNPYIRHIRKPFSSYPYYLDSSYLATYSY